MSTILLTGVKASRRVSFILQPLYSSSCSVRHASINSGINRGLRKSKGVGFRAKEYRPPSRKDDAGGRGFKIPGSYPEKKQDRGPADGLKRRNKSMHTRFKGNGRDDKSKPKYNTSSPFEYHQDKDTYKNGKYEKSHRLRASDPRQERSSGRYEESRNGKSRYEQGSYKSYGAQDETSSYEKKRFNKSNEFPEARLSHERKTFKKSSEPRDNGSEYERKSYPNLDEASKMLGMKYKPAIKYKYKSTRKESKGSANLSTNPNRKERIAVRDGKFRSLPESLSFSPSSSFRSLPPAEDSSAYASQSPSEFSPAKNTSTFYKKMPITIPYTTPASEFLYGTSVVEAALTARPRRGRKLYKLYIHKGEDIQNGGRDGVIARLAQKRGVEVVIVKGFDWLRTLDKMSQSRPHNGYVLEASPLPRLPVISLGEVIDQENSSALKLTLDYQSREESEINGTDSIIKVPKDSSGRKPLILFLDSIEDPGNLGALLRTAAFMGVAAVAISARNSSSLTAVVYKASAGATETLELFSVNKPLGFIKDSQAAGWKVYAAVAPPAHRPDSRYMWPTTLKECVWTHDLQDPLREDPCILMVGGEGEGLRKNMRDLADVNISIKGAPMRGKLDSLNVSVATGILCDAFMRQTTRKTVEEAVKEVEEEMENLDENQVFSNV